MSYYNTNKERGRELFNSEYKAQNQEELILSLFNTGSLLSPDEILDICNQHYSYPITSIRRALTDLTSKGLLIKTNSFRMGRYGKKTHTWTLPSNIEAQNKIDFNNIQVVDMDYLQSQYPEYEDSFVVEAEWKDTGVTLTDEEIDAVNDDRDFVYETLQDFLH